MVKIFTSELLWWTNYVEFSSRRRLSGRQWAFITFSTFLCLLKYVLNFLGNVLWGLLVIYLNRNLQFGFWFSTNCTMYTVYLLTCSSYSKQLLQNSWKRVIMRFKITRNSLASLARCTVFMLIQHFIHRLKSQNHLEQHNKHYHRKVLLSSFHLNDLA